jgi:hypothetical protein
VGRVGFASPETPSSCMFSTGRRLNAVQAYFRV